MSDQIDGASSYSATKSRIILRQTALTVLLAAACLMPAWAQPAPLVVHHALRVVLDPAAHTLDVQDTIELPAAEAEDTTWVFVLHDGLAVTGPAGTAARPASNTGFDLFPVPAQRITVPVPAGVHTVTLKYSGKIEHGISGGNAADASSISDSPGFIGPNGAFLGETSLWYPQHENDLVTFKLQVATGQDWTTVSQGSRTQNEHAANQTTVTWEETNPQESIYLVSAPFVEYSAKTGPVEAMVFLRTADPALAKQYLDATDRYIAMFSKLVGPYPYGKFALVENTWETGFGMPSFTLLGSNVLRLPFIIQSSYPHEILHNWWGNGVYVDYDSGNWGEGLTAYLGDQLLREQRGEGAAGRRGILQNYTDFVSTEQDFPIAKFNSRHSSSSEAVGYGKAQMVFHMLRVELGDAVFNAGLRDLYKTYRFKKARFSDLERTFSEVSHRVLKPFFVQWIDRAGAATLKIRGASTAQSKGIHNLRLTLEQTQTGQAFGLRIPVAITLKDQETAHETFVLMSEKTQSFVLKLPGQPMRIDIDPEFDVFRRLDRGEIPPALSQAYGARKSTIILPSHAPSELLAAYQTLAKTWQSGAEGQVDIKLDKDIKQLPKDQSLWIVGWENTWASSLAAPLQSLEAQLTDDALTIGSQVLVRGKNAVAVTAHLKSNSAHAITFIGCDNLRALPGLTSKLPHYRKYSYVAFEGNTPTNILKGQWENEASPMTVLLDNKNGKIGRGKLAARPALVE